MNLFLVTWAPFKLTHVKKIIITKEKVSNKNKPVCCLWYLLPGTCYIILITWYLLTDTCYLILVSCNTCFLIDITWDWYLLPDSCYLIFITWYLLPDTLYLYLDTWFWRMLLVTKYLLQDICHFILFVFREVQVNCLLSLIAFWTTGVG